MSSFMFLLVMVGYYEERFEMVKIVCNGLVRRTT